jgi:hypothetical protein
MARETFSGAQALGISRIMYWGRVLGLLDHLTATDRCCRRQVSGLQPNSADSQRATPSKALLCVCTFQASAERSPAHRHSSRFACAHISERQFLMLAPKAFELEPRPRRVSSSTTARLQREEFLLRLKRFPPIRQGGRFPAFKSSTVRTLLHLSLLRRTGSENSSFRLGKKICIAHTFYLLNGIQ